MSSCKKRKCKPSRKKRRKKTKSDINSPCRLITNDYCIYGLIDEVKLRGYIGITNNVEKRLRQHNSEITGGRKLCEWDLAYALYPMMSKHSALCLEWAIHHFYKTHKEMQADAPELKRFKGYGKAGENLYRMIVLLSRTKWTEECVLPVLHTPLQLYIQDAALRKKIQDILDFRTCLPFVKTTGIPPNKNCS